jgi:Lrp/AsnC family transcriptional regulator for asnA, asnC and gidA
VRRHVEELRSTGTIEITTVANPELLGYGSTAMLGIRVDHTVRPSELAGRIAKVSGVDYAVVATGRYHLLVELLGRDASELMATIEDSIMPIPGVVGCETFPYLRHYYQQFDWNAARRKEPDRGSGPRQPAIDDVDRKIIVALNADGRTPLGQVARQVGVSESLVRQRLNRLLGEDAIRIMAMTHPASLGLSLITWFAVVASPGVKLSDLADQIADRNAITYLAICGGRFDILAEAVCGDRAELLALVDEEIRPIPGVARVEMWTCMDMHLKSLTPRF